MNATFPHFSAMKALPATLDGDTPAVSAGRALDIPR